MSISIAKEVKEGGFIMLHFDIKSRQISKEWTYEQLSQKMSPSTSPTCDTDSITQAPASNGSWILPFLNPQRCLCESLSGTSKPETELQKGLLDYDLKEQICWICWHRRGSLASQAMAQPHNEFDEIDFPVAIGVAALGRFECFVLIPTLRWKWNNCWNQIWKEN